MISSIINLVLLSNGSYWYWHIWTLYTIFTLPNSFFKGGSGRKKYNGTKRNSTPSLLSCLCLTITSSSSPVDQHIQRINYGIVFEKTHDIYLGQEHWLHTFQIPLPKKLYLPELYCNMPLCKTAGHIITSLNLLRMQCMASVNSTVHHIHDRPGFYNRTSSREKIYWEVKIKTRTLWLCWKNLQVSFWNSDIRGYRSS